MATAQRGSACSIYRMASQTYFPSCLYARSKAGLQLSFAERICKTQNRFASLQNAEEICKTRKPISATIKMAAFQITRAPRARILRVH